MGAGLVNGGSSPEERFAAGRPYAPYSFSIWTRMTEQMLDFCAKHHLGAEIEVIGADQINEAYERVLAPDVRYRFVIDTSTLS